MLKNLNKYIYLFLFIFVCNIQSGYSSDYGSIKKTTRDYLKLHKSFSKQLCRPGTEPKYLKLLRKYRGNGVYLPESNGKIDIDIIEKYLPLLREKRQWINSQYKYLLKLKHWPYYKALTFKLNDSLNKLLEFKKQYFLALKPEEKEKIRNKSTQQMEIFKKQFQIFLKNIPYFLGFKHPVDHLKNRRDYAKIKDDEDKKKESNDIFFYRRILEDGAMDPNHTRPDKFFRSTLDTLALKIPAMVDFIDEEVRYDLDFIFSKLKRALRRGKRAHIKRMKAWEKRVREIVLFYRKIIHNQKGNHAEINQQILSERLKANEALKKFVYELQAEVYLYWRKQSSLMKKIFVLETILFNEVGTVDGMDALERHDVARVVKNRVGIEEYRYIDKKQDLYTELRKTLSDEEIQSDHWLNVLFKKGEFSFTYFYISGVAKIFCPDMTRRGKKLRKANVKIALDILSEAKTKLEALRYFSRASMNGRIDMSTVWEGYTALNERPGKLAKMQRRLIRLFLSSQYKYLYNFEDENSTRYMVIQIKDETYVTTWRNRKPVFFNYRNPNYFRYFKPVSN